MRRQRHKSVRKSKAVRSFWKEVGGRGPVDAVNRICKDLLNRLGRKIPPFQTGSQNRFEYAKLLDIPVKQVDIKCDGILIRNGQRYIIQVQKSSKPEKKNFTVCHEIGHIQILQHARKFLSRQLHCNTGLLEYSKEEEQLSDIFAKNLLMPHKIFQHYASHCEPGIDSLFELANTFCTSLTATSFRLTELNLWPSVILWALPMTYYNGRIGLKKLCTTNPRGLISPFGEKKEDFVGTDIFHKTVDSGSRRVYNFQNKDYFGNIRVWNVQSMPQYFSGKRCALIVATLQESVILGEKSLANKTKEFSYL